MRKKQFIPAVICILVVILLTHPMRARDSKSCENLFLPTSFAVIDTTVLNQDSSIVMKEVVVDGTRAGENTPVSYTNLSQKDISALSNGQDLPFLLRLTPSLIATSDAGNGIGYTGLWIRGSDPSRINVTINGIPLNDPESQQVFWVNTPDFSASSNQIQVQRGIGTSSNGAASFGGAIKIETRGISAKPFTEVSSLYGSFNSMRQRVSFGTGLTKDRFYTEGRLSYISSDGYIDRAASSLASAYIETGYLAEKTVIKLIAFGGREKTYQSWYGTPASVVEGNLADQLAFALRNELSFEQTMNLISSGRTYNYYQYENQVDNYAQDHAQLHMGHQFNKHWTLNLSANYTHGFGYFEEFKEGEAYSSYGLSPVILQGDTTNETDLIRRRWLRNHSYGGIGSLTYKSQQIESILGGAWNEYRGEHYGELIWMQYAGETPIGHRYYQGNSLKRDYNIYWKTNYKIARSLELYADLQLRNVRYNTAGTDNDLRNYDITDQITFFNPKAGFVYRPNQKHRVMASLAFGGKEPNRNDYVDALDVTKVKPETMTDLEFSYTFTHQKSSATVTLYNMDYTNQLVLTGELNDVGAPLRTNVPESYRRGIEFEISSPIAKNFLVAANTTLSRNRIKQFDLILYDYTNGFDIQTTKMEDTPISFSPEISAAGQLIWRIESRDQKVNAEIAWIGKFVGQQYLDNTGSDIASLDPYFINDARASITFKCKRDTEIGLQFWCNNVFNQMYSSNGYAYSYIYGAPVTEVFYYPQAGRNMQGGIQFKF